MTSAITGVSSFADVVGQVGGLTAATTGFGTAASSATAVAAMCAPPGNDADSVQATAQNAATTAEFITSLGAGIEQLGERAAETTTENVAFEALGVAGGAAIAAI
ncbi:Uncharacterised protein [Mycobacteroides abscessus subsp. abscessus]|uniref:hypothetical protein n=1 Tax=Mycobacteroides abscessus TaxID=36809 RepID=UPI00092A64A5|nr:hypothetical protein [Mycobacteroides abscessus]SIM03559.1 Uncharacterised protein [Mycobacteroides abscessus subsp. abscessus]SKT54102.1 Uncharacterised protein [Mycobacteroides abscessus subsp. massiliense]SLC78194.1 Uncharacterised protein [Mycobacteroides abscessus subsp. abscessus]